MIGKIQRWMEGRVDFGENLKGVRTHYWVSGKIRAALSYLFSCCISPCDTVTYKFNNQTFYLNKRSCVRWINQHSGSGYPTVSLSDSSSHIHKMIVQICTQKHLSDPSVDQPSSSEEDNLPPTDIDDILSPVISPVIVTANSKRDSLQFVVQSKPSHTPFGEALSRFDECNATPDIYRELIRVFLKEPHKREGAEAFSLWNRMCFRDKEMSISLQERLELLEQLCRHQKKYSLARKHLGQARHLVQVEEYQRLRNDNPHWDAIESDNGWAIYQEALSQPDQLATHTYELAAEHGSAHAKFKLAQILENSGKGQEAFEVYQEIAMEGFRPAQIKMSEFYKAGLYVQKNLQCSAAWTSLAKCPFTYG